MKWKMQIQACQSEYFCKRLPLYVTLSNFFSQFSVVLPENSLMLIQQENEKYIIHKYALFLSGRNIFKKCIYFSDLFFTLKPGQERKREKRDLSTTDSLSIGLQQLELGWSKSGSKELPLGFPCGCWAPTLGPFSHSLMLSQAICRQPDRKQSS